MVNTNDMIKTREEYVDLIKKELLGPGSEICIPDLEHELISTRPEQRYSIGILFPKNNRMNVDADDVVNVITNSEVEEPEEENDTVEKVNKNKKESAFSGDEENLDEEISLAAQNMPSSMGITFFVHGTVDVLKCKITFGTYRKAIASDCVIPFNPSNPEDYEIPNSLSGYIVYDKEYTGLRLSSNNLNNKIIKDLQDREVLKDDEYRYFDLMRKLCNQLRNGYVRIPHSVEVSLVFNENDYIDNNKNLDETNAKVTALRRKVGDELYSVTIMLVNDSATEASGDNCILQPVIEVNTENNNFVFAEYSDATTFEYMEAEEKSLALQYRNKKVYGTGLGTSVDWAIDDYGKGSIRNDFFPLLEVPQMDFSLPADSAVDVQTLSMKYLSDLNDVAKEEKISNLKTLVSAYGNWIDCLEGRVQALDLEFPGKNFVEIAEKNIYGCRKAYNRMIQGIEKLSSNNKIWDAFVLANRAMFMQRVHLELQKLTSDIERYPEDDALCDILDEIDYYADEGIVADKYYWRPFQLAFLLMSVNGIVDDTSSDRSIVDLIWFPTGGGKTEAYLGLTAFTIFYRRLNNLSNSSGTAVVMRYTLRLLAAQQFTRASTLICACEYIRNDSSRKRPRYKSYVLGSESITIGLWIGNEHTPNKNKDAEEFLKKLQSSTASNIKENKEKYNKFQVLKCPWCGTKLVKDVDANRLKGEFAYRMRDRKHFEMYCPQESCYFNEAGKLPIQIVDEELYLNPPTLLFGTVDKFAMLPWKKEIGNFFAASSNNRGPELIIQDELHLISGPLGTMVGLYETVIDALCQAKGTKAKIVASTATIRRATEQCSALYDRETSQFPHPALDAEDSFFARELPINHTDGKYGRLYVGLMPSGKTKAMMEVRAIAALLQKIHTMPLSYEIKDNYWTLTVYFNSLKDLGKCSTLVDDDVKDFIKRTSYRTGTARDARIIVGADELTSRVSTTELNETLDKLEKLKYSKENIENKRYASNILLATNMISVGIDVARLNVMLIVGQPKLTSEYIQASSRIGRSYPGVAFAMYDGTKSRDRSHYEQFKSYHESFYKFVEPTGITPFSKPACDRALHAIVIALLRHLEPELASEKGAGLFSMEKYAGTIEKIKSFIVKRDSSIILRANNNMQDDSALLSDEIESILSQWQCMIEQYGEERFEYGSKYWFKSPDDGFGRLMKVFNTNKNDLNSLDTMTSMRNVDTTVAGNVLIWED